MCIIEKSELTLDELFCYYCNRMQSEKKNIERVKRFYECESSFNALMCNIIEKDQKRCEKMIKENKPYPAPWRFFFVILDIVQNEGTEIEPFDYFTRSFPSRNMEYCGWKFSITHVAKSVVSVYNWQNALVYRFGF